MDTPLSNLMVLDLSRVLAGPWASQSLADLGATVIKVEQPGAGDDTRLWGPPYLSDDHGNRVGESGYFLAANRGKYSITVDLKTDAGKEIILELAKKADIVLENFKTGTLDRMGLGYSALKEVKPDIILCSITGFGQTGPRAKQPAYDFMIQAMSGIMSVTGESDDRPGGSPMKIGIPLIDLITGVYSTSAVLASVVRRERTGRGEHIDIAMLDVAVSLLANQGMNYLLTGQTPVRRGNRHPNIQPQRVYRCIDGQIILAVGNDGQFAKLCAALGKPELAASEKFSTNDARVRNLPELDLLLDELLATFKKAELLAELESLGVPSGPINTIPEVLADPQVVHRQMQFELQDEHGVSIPQIRSPYKFSEASTRLNLRPPAMGEHTESVLKDILGLNARRIQELRQNSVI